MAGPVVWALTPGPPLGRPPPALRAHLKTNGQVTAEGSCGSQPGRAAADARLVCTLATLHRGRTCGPPALSVSRLPGLLGWGQPEEKDRNLWPLQTLEGGWMGGVGFGYPSKQRLGLQAWLSARGSRHAAREEAGAVTMATVSKGVWKDVPLPCPEAGKILRGGQQPQPWTSQGRHT